MRRSNRKSTSQQSIQHTKFQYYCVYQVATCEKVFPLNIRKHVLYLPSAISLARILAWLRTATAL
jgi:hypothetical protein